MPLALAAPPAAALAGVCAAWVAIGAGWSSVETPGRLVRRVVDRRDLHLAFAAQFSLSHACWLVACPLAGRLGTCGLARAATTPAVVAVAATVLARVLWPASADGAGQLPRADPGRTGTRVGP
ncbi:hypothetical protein [Oerskovia sp. USHLN155]|uniref:hypothetical protein n=1 Tax=Oerskovia sp. USHLN155 TaxID=3081288 RepID=UPI003016D9B4